MKLFNIFKKKKKDKQQDTEYASLGESEAAGARPSGTLTEAEARALKEAMKNDLPPGVDVQTKVESTGGYFYYLLKIINNTDDIMGDLKVAISPEGDVLSCEKPLKSAKFIDPGKNVVLKFKLKPSMQCGKTTIEGMIRYFDFGDKSQKEYDLPEYDINIMDPQIKGKEVNEDVWRVTMGKLPSYEVETGEITYEPARVFNHLSKIAKNLGFYELKPNIVPTLYRGIGRYFGLDGLKEPYLMEIQVIGKGKTSRLLYRVWSSDLTAAMGIAFRLLGRVDKRLGIKSKIQVTK